MVRSAAQQRRSYEERRNQGGGWYGGFPPTLVLAPLLLFQGDDYGGERFSSEILRGTIVLSEEQWRIDFDVSAHEADGTPIDLALVEVFARANDPEIRQVTIRREGTGDGAIFIFPNSVDDGSIRVHWSMQVDGSLDAPPVLVVEPGPLGD